MIPFKSLNFAKLSHRERLFVGGCLFVLFIVFLDRMVLSALLERVSYIRREIRTLEQAVANHNKLLSRKPVVLADVEHYREYLRPVVSEDVEMARLLGEIERFAKRSHVSLGNIRHLSETETESELYQEYVIELQFESSLKEWLEFVYLIESSKSLFSIQKARLAKEEGQELLKGYLVLSKIAMRGGEV